MTRTSRSLWLIAAGIAAIAALNLFVLTRRGPVVANAEAAAATDPGAPAVVAAPGLVEPKSESIRIGAEIGGRLARVLVDEGDTVQAGQVIAEIVNDDFRARIASAEADLAARQADARRVNNGARAEERRGAEADVRQAEADLEHAKADHARSKELFDEKVISRAEMDKAEQALRMTAARVDSLRERHAFVNADAREEDRARADADIALARARLSEARAVYEKTFVRSPIDGIVLRRHAKPGESVSTQFDSPIVTLADRSAVRVRVDVDETDVARVKVGQAAYVTADAYGVQKFPGKVVRVGQILGKKNIRTDEPTERVDQKVLETLIELADGHELPIGLRVRAFIE